ncbi:hypothetical protein ACFOOL_12425 [Devosia honganensis]|uniref:Uncharacterized protein n=1 Tax=Devosia honganensis TaxID=1610527 RepID=A0ABV7X4L4_9HYPH
MQHRYKVGQMLELRSAPRHSNRPAGPCEVISCLPHESGPLLYRVKSRNETNDRVVAEADLRPTDAAKVLAEHDDSPFTIAVSKR